MKNVTSWLSDTEVAIYLFHGVVGETDVQVRNYNRKHLPIDEFTAVCGELKSHGTAVSMDDIVEAWNGGRPLPPRAFAITFDDGFENNHSLAAPVLNDLKLPATFYVTTDFIENNTMSWVDRIELVVEDVAEGQLRLPWGECRFDSVETKIDVLGDIRTHVKSDHTLNAQDLATDIQIQLGFAETHTSSHPLDQKMNWKEVCELDASDNFIVAGHSHTHPILAFLDDQTLAWEINASIEMLKDKAKITSPHYAYPEGLAHTYDERTIQLLKANGITCSPSAIEGTNAVGYSLFDLRRIMVM